MPLYITPPPPNPLTRLLMVVVSAGVLVVSFTLGLVILAVVAGLGLVTALALWLRVAWMRRRLRKGGAVPGSESVQPRSEEFLEAEYTVVRRQDEREGQDL